MLCSVNKNNSVIRYKYAKYEYNNDRKNNFKSKNKFKNRI